MVAKKKSKNVISQHTNIHMLHTQIYYSHTHTVVCLHVCTLNASQLHLHLLIRKKFIFFKKMQPCAALQTRKWHDDDVNGNSVRVCVQIQYISVQQQLTYLNIYRDTRTHTYKYIIVAHTLARTHSIVRGTHSHWHRPQSHLIILY